MCECNNYPSLAHFARPENNKNFDLKLLTSDSQYLHTQ